MLGGKVPAHRKNAPSAFSVTINANQTKQSLMRQGVNPNVFFKQFRESLKYFRENAAKFVTKDMNRKKKINVIKTDFEMEYGEARHLLHAHGFVKFDNYCLLDVPLIRKFFNKALLVEIELPDGTKGMRGTKGTIVWVKHAPDYEESLKRYARKSLPNII
jgi:hypothetical protein